MIAGKYRKIIIIITIVTTIITIIGVLWKYIMRMYLHYKFQTNTNSASSIGIIGSADGPTSIYLSGSQYLGLITIIFGLLSVLGIIYLIATRKVKSIER